jgi:peptide-methionine (S)-S-oxide reductase
MKPLLVVLAFLSTCLFAGCQNQTKMSVKTKDMDVKNVPVTDRETITLGGGCFWCTEAVYQEVEGVYSVESGYSGGSEEDANYPAVCTGQTGHAEVVQVVFNPKVVNLEDILKMFFATHNPTTLNRQGNDVGYQYRSAIFYHSEAQKAVAEKSIKEFAPTLWEDPIVTKVEPFLGFYKAEEDHQNYYSLVGNRNPYCTFIITPKITKFRKEFASKLKKG